MKCPKCGGNLVYNVFMEKYVCFRCNASYSIEELEKLLKGKRVRGTLVSVNGYESSRDSQHYYY